MSVQIQRAKVEWHKTYTYSNFIKRAPKLDTVQISIDGDGYPKSMEYTQWLKVKLLVQQLNYVFR